MFRRHAGAGDSVLLVHMLLVRYDCRIRIRHVAYDELPADEAARVAWLDDWWARLDAWVEGQGVE